MPARLGQLTNRRLTLTSLGSVCPIQWNVGQVTKSLSALLTLCPDKTASGQKANLLTTSTSPALGDPNETCRPNRAQPARRPGCFYTHPTYKHLACSYLTCDQGSHSNHPLIVVKRSVSRQRNWAHKHRRLATQSF